MSSGAVWVMVPQLKVSMRDCASSCRAMPKSATCTAESLGFRIYTIHISQPKLLTL
jgi:hypothetical protein